MHWLANAHKISINQFTQRHSIVYLSSVLKSLCAHVLLNENWTHFPTGRCSLCEKEVQYWSSFVVTISLLSQFIEIIGMLRLHSLERLCLNWAMCRSATGWHYCHARIFLPTERFGRQYNCLIALLSHLSCKHQNSFVTWSKRTFENAKQDLRHLFSIYKKNTISNTIINQFRYALDLKNNILSIAHSCLVSNVNQRTTSNCSQLDTASSGCLVAAYMSSALVLRRVIWGVGTACLMKD